MNYDNQKNKVFDYAKNYNLFLLDFVYLHNAPKSTSKDLYLLDSLHKDDICVVAHPLVLGGSVIEVLSIIKALYENNIEVLFIDYGQLSTNGINASWLCLIFDDIVKIQKDIISYRTKLGLKATKKKGVKLGRPKGAKNKVRFLDDFRDEILNSLNNGLSPNKILTSINNKIEKKLSYPSMKHFIDNDKELKKARDNFKNSLLR